MEAATIDKKYRFKAVSFHNNPNEEKRNLNEKIAHQLSQLEKWARSEYVSYNYDRNVRYDKNMKSSKQGIIESYSTVVHIEKDLSFNSDK